MIHSIIILITPLLPFFFFFSLDFSANFFNPLIKIHRLNTFHRIQFSLNATTGIPPPTTNQKTIHAVRALSSP